MAPHLLRPMYAFRMLSNSVTGGRRAPWHSAPFVSSALRAPPLPHCAERHAALRQKALLTHKGDSEMVPAGNVHSAHHGNSALAPQHLTMPRESGWTAQRGKGGARRAEDTSEAVHPGSLGVQDLPSRLGVQNLPGCQGVQNHQHQKQIRHPQQTQHPS